MCPDLPLRVGREVPYKDLKVNGHPLYITIYLCTFNISFNLIDLWINDDDDDPDPDDIGGERSPLSRVCGQFKFREHQKSPFRATSHPYLIPPSMKMSACANCDESHHYSHDHGDKHGYDIQDQDVWTFLLMLITARGKYNFERENINENIMMQISVDMISIHIARTAWCPPIYCSPKLWCN